MQLLYQMKMSSVLIGGSLLGALLPLAYKFGDISIHTLDIPLVLLGLYVLARRKAVPYILQRKQSGRELAACNGTISYPPQLNGIDIALAITLFLAFFSSLVSFNYISTLDTLAAFVRAAIFYALVRHLLLTRQFSFHDFALISAIFWCGLAILGALQYATQSHIGSISTYFGETRSLDSWYESHYITSVKIVGTSHSPNIFALWIVFFTTVLNVYFSVAFRHFVFRKLLLVAVINSISLSLLFLSASRGGILYYIISMALLYVVVPGVWGGGSWLRIFTLLAVVIFLLLTTGAMIYRIDLETVPLLAKGAVTGDDPRWTYYAYSWDLLQHPTIFFFGTGFRAFYPALYAFDVDLGWHSQYGLVDYSTYRSGPHNLFLNALVEGGVFFFIAVVAVFIAGVLLPLRALRSVADINQSAALVFSIVSVPGLAVMLAADDYAFYAYALVFAVLPFAFGSAGVVNVCATQRATDAEQLVCTGPLSPAVRPSPLIGSCRRVMIVAGAHADRIAGAASSQLKRVRGRNALRHMHGTERRRARMTRPRGPS